MAFTDEQIEAAVNFDARLRAIATGVEVGISMADGGPLNAVLGVLGRDADAALREFAFADLSDMRLLQDLQARVYRFRVTFETLKDIVSRGESVERDIRSEDQL